MNTIRKTHNAKPDSIRNQLIKTLLIGLPLLFLIIAIGVSIPLYQQIIDDDDEAMQQFSQMVLNDRMVEQSFQNSLNKESLEHMQQLSNQVFDEQIDTPDPFFIEDILFAESFELAIWDKSGNLIEDDQPDINKTDELSKKTPSILTGLDIKNISHGFHNIGNIFSKNSWRVYITTNPKTGETIAVAQSLKERITNIIGFISEQMLMLLLSLPILIAMVIWAVHKGLRPLNTLTNEIQTRHTNDLAPVSEYVPSELQPLTKALNQLFIKVADGIDKQKRFTAEASHELKTPITAIKIQANELQHHLQQGLIAEADTHHSNESTLEALQSAQRIQKTADRSSHLIEQLLTLTKLDDASASNSLNKIKKQPINWLSISEQALQSVSRLARNHGVKLQRHIHTKDESHILPMAEGGNPVLLVLMFRNLLENAICYGASDKTVTKKHIELTLAAHYISIRDYGNGISKEHLTRIRERFFRPAGQTHTGSGLGLSIVDRVAELHGLNVEIENCNDMGVMVKITINERL
ncbi:ATP-binding protein [Psychrobacter sp. HD31]|uniref:ATP-binding protein n=1 Tax=Psychrobacter sp. HD31 TaxID=3112003 RepID=UPI003DA364A5